MMSIPTTTNDGYQPTVPGGPSPPSSLPASLPTELAIRSDNNLNIHVSLTPLKLNIAQTLDLIRSPDAGALVFFAGTTRRTFNGKTVHSLSYTSYLPLCINTLFNIATSIREEFKLEGIAIAHRLGEVGVAEESVHIAVASAHRKEAWMAGEEALERVKRKAEIWKLEELVEEKQMGGRREEGGWRTNQEP